MHEGESRVGRQVLAIRAAAAVVRQHGLDVPEARILSDCNNTIVHFPALSLVAKVCHTTERPCGAAALRRELEIAQHLTKAGAPIVPLSSELPAAVHTFGTQALTFWQYSMRDLDTALDSRAAGQALAAVHAALATYRGPMPSFLDGQVKRTGRLLAEAVVPSGLAPSEGDFLACEHRRLTGALVGRDLCVRVLHGDPHAGNFLVNRGRHLLIDFESACSGPLEWDLSALADVGPAFPHDPTLLALLRRLRSLCAAVWCMARARRSPELERAGRLHLAVLHERRHPDVAAHQLRVA
ncbi:MAG TPA: aminoglycoside phosphotransferase family protein [Candidatus Dormibacteraeota bacterium]|nr:aminoglycoside phosphotransferase family protein [Candidatus Dormibacteraeota bacterium]